MANYPYMTSIVWHRGDVRVHDHPALWTAQQQGRVLPLLIIDDHIFQRETLSARRYYPAPMVEHKVARARFLQLAKEVLH